MHDNFRGINCYEGRRAGRVDYIPKGLRADGCGDCSRGITWDQCST